ncbi:hypothetical protein GCM10020254_28370 [Streptomyces goshikiensis]
MRGSFKAPEEAGSGAPQGLPAKGRALTTAIRWISETFGFYKARPARVVCLRNYSGFLLSETADPPETPCPALRFSPLRSEVP